MLLIYSVLFLLVQIIFCIALHYVNALHPTQQKDAEHVPINILWKDNLSFRYLPL